MSIKNTIFLFVYFLIFLFGCNQYQKIDENIYSKPPEDKLDSLGAWLDNYDNGYDKNYLNVFIKHYNQQISKSNLDSAAHLLLIVGRNLSENDRFDRNFMQICQRFMAENERKLSDRFRTGIYLNIGDLYSDIGKFDSSIYYLNKTQIIAHDNYTYFNKAVANYSLLYCNLNIGKQDSSLAAGFRAMNSFEKMNYISGQAAVHSGISCIYRYMDDFAEAEKYIDKSLLMFENAKDSSNMFATYIDKVALYHEINHKNLLPMIDSSLIFYKKWHSTKNPNQILTANSWLAFKLTKENKLSEAKKVLDTSKPILNQITNQLYKDYYSNALAEYEVKIGKGTADKSIYENIIPYVTESEQYQKLILYNDILGEDALLKKDYKNALKYTLESQRASDSLSNKDLRMRVKELDKKYQTEKKEQQINLQKSEITQKNAYIGLLIASLVGLLLAVFAYYSWQKQKTLKQEKTNSMNFTKQLLENTEDERKRIASDLHDSISHELLNLKSIFKQDLTTVNTKIDTIINDIRGISRNLHPVMFDKIGLVPNLEQLVERIQNQNNFLVSTDIAYTGSLTSADELQIYRIIQEALTNIIKYAKAHAAKITILEEKDKIFIEIKDNGKGFNLKETLNSGKAFGLHNIIERSRVIGGEAHIQSSAEGTIININIPKKA